MTTPTSSDDWDPNALASLREAILTGVCPECEVSYIREGGCLCSHDQARTVVWGGAHLKKPARRHYNTSLACMLEGDLQGMAKHTAAYGVAQVLGFDYEEALASVS